MTITHGMTHLRASNPETNAPTGECGQMGDELAVTDEPWEVDCPQCRRAFLKVPLRDLLERAQFAARALDRLVAGLDPSAWSYQAERSRMVYKAEGVRLVISYIEESLRG